MKNLDAIVPELATYIPNYNQTNKGISEASVGWHIVHCLLVIKQITSTVAQSDPKLYKSKFNMTRFFIFLSKTIPRGKAKAPKVVIPTDEITLEYLQDHLKNTYGAITYLKDCEKNQYFMHPFFGQLNKKQTIKFLAIHTEHHLKIIRDILK
ncbi:MAG: DinB family protein [Sediminibacterium sp.]